MAKFSSLEKNHNFSCSLSTWSPIRAEEDMRMSKAIIFTGGGARGTFWHNGWIIWVLKIKSLSPFVFTWVKWKIYVPCRTESQLTALLSKLSCMAMYHRATFKFDTDQRVIFSRKNASYIWMAAVERVWLNAIMYYLLLNNHVLFICK